MNSRGISQTSTPSLQATLSELDFDTVRMDRRVPICRATSAGPAMLEASITEISQTSTPSSRTSLSGIDYDTVRIDRRVCRPTYAGPAMPEASITENLSMEHDAATLSAYSTGLACGDGARDEVSSPVGLPSPAGFVPTALDPVQEWDVDVLRKSGFNDVEGLTRAVSESVPSMHAVVRLIEALQKQSEETESQTQEVSRLQKLVGDMDLKHAEAETQMLNEIHLGHKRGRSLTKRIVASEVGHTRRCRSLTRRVHCVRSIANMGEVADTCEGVPEEVRARHRQRWASWLTRRPWRRVRLSKLRTTLHLSRSCSTSRTTSTS